MDNIKTTRIEDKDGIKVIRFLPFEKYDFFEAAFSTRIGGVSSGYYSSMNLSYTRGDDPLCVTQNYKLISDFLGVSYDMLTCSYQTHTNNVRIVTDEMIGNGISKEYTFSDVDGLITDKENVVLVTSYADCVPVFIVDINKKIVSATHSGWRGTVKNIAKNTVDKMIKTYNSSKADMIAYIGPSICKQCYEVGEDVASEFKKHYTDDEIRHILEPRGEKYLLDLHMANKINLINAGISEDNISITDICTSCNDKLLFSHRKSKGLRGGNCGFIWLKKNAN